MVELVSVANPGSLPSLKVLIMLLPYLDMCNSLADQYARAARRRYCLGIASYSI